jgi:molecular chaperone DnaK (HSP70)
VTGDAAAMLGSEVKDVVITCPAYFGAAECTATKNAGIIAGLNVLEIIREPTAAAIYYGCTKGDEEKTILVYDLGGGTFDVTIMRINADKIEVVCSDGDHDLGGKDWDKAIVKYMANEFRSQTGFDDDFDEYAQQDMRLKAEKAKQQLSSRNETAIMMDVAGLRGKITLTREKFDEITAIYLTESINKTDAAIAVAKEKGYTIDEILLVGGSTRMPQVTKALVDKYGIEPKILEPDEAVAKGAAIHAVNVYVNNQKSLEPNASGETTVNVGNTTKEINADDYKEDLVVQPEMMTIGGRAKEVVVATTKSFALELLNARNEPRCVNMIIKNEPMPDGSITVKKMVGTQVAGQTSAELVVYENDFMEEEFDVDKDLVLGTALLELPDNLPANSPIQVTFTLNSEGILEVGGEDMTAHREVHVTMQSKGIMAAEKVDELKEKSKGIVVM